MKSITPNLNGCLLAALLAGAAESAAATAEIVAAEYYLNGDPSPGNGVPITGFTPGKKIALALDVPVDLVAGLSQGMHVLTVRFQDAEGDWSNAYSRYFLREDLTLPPSSTPLAAAEYYINTDPGPGKGIPISLASDKWSHGFVIDVPASAIAPLNPGFHWITGRVRNANGSWLVAFTRGFLKEDLVPDAETSLVSHIEYRWIQNGSQVGATVTLRPDTPADKVTFDLLASLQGLVEGGTYRLVATPFNTRGIQGISTTANVTIETIDSDGDGLPDFWEMTHGFDPADAADGILDPDGDGLDNRAEFLAKTNPKAADTSGDGISDKLAIDLGLNPLLSYPSISATLAGLQEGTAPTEDQVRALYPGVPLLSRNAQTGKFDLRIGIQQSTSLGAWQKLPLQAGDSRFENGDMIFSFQASDPTRFFRVTADE
jgi:hypothetical protein